MAVSPRRVSGLIPGLGLAELTIESGLVATLDVVTSAPGETWRGLSADHLLLLPGLLDLQVNGYGGVDFSSPGLTREQVRRVVELLWAEGVTGFCPTVITGPADQMTASVTMLAEASLIAEVGDALLGTHLEGPWISPVDGARGAHPTEHVRAPDFSELERLRASGDIALVTVAPEMPGAVALISAATEAGVLVSIGHSLAEPDDVRAAVVAGATLSTHLGNGIPAQLRRHPNLVWEQLGTDALTAMFIADGHHLDLSTLRTMVRAKGAGRWMLVSDSTSLGGMSPGRYQTHIGGEVELDGSGRLGMVGTEYLAGAAASLRVGLANAWAAPVAEASDVLAAVTARPAAVLGARAGNRGALEPGHRADLVLARWDEQARSLVVAGDPGPGAHGLVRTMTGELRAGVATVEFTPSAGVAMSGFGARTGPSTGAHDALSARAVAVSSGSAGSIVVVADLVALTVGQVDRLRLDIARRTGLPEEAVVVTVTHTHAGPHVTPDGLGPGYDQEVAETVERAIVSAAVDAWSSRRAARWGHGRGEERTVAHNRRDPSGPVDPDVTVVRIDTEGGDPLAVLFSYSCHPVVLGAGNVLFSADWPGYARTAVEGRLSGTTAVFLQGCCGQVNTGHSAHASMDLSAAAGRTFEAAELLGRRVGDVASSVAAEIATTAGDRVAVSSVQVSLAHSTAPGPEQTAALIADGERELAAGSASTGRWCSGPAGLGRSAPAGEGFPPPPQVTVTALAWGDLDIVTLPGEPFVGFSTDIRAQTPDRDVLVLGYANGVPGYLPYPPTEYDAGGYEVEEAHFFYGQSQCFAPACGPLLVETAVSLLAGLPPPGARAAEPDGQG